MAKKKPVEVVARQQGLYGKVREVGEPFYLKDEADRSKRWMVDADSDEGKELRKEYERTHGPIVTVAVADEAINEELAQAQQSQVSALKRENDRLKKELADAGERIAQLEAAAQGHGEPNAGDAGVDPQDSEDRRRTDDDSSNEDSKPRARRRRTS